MTPHKLVLRSWLSPGDIVVMTAAVRDLHTAHPGRFITDVQTPCPAVWENNPFIRQLDISESELVQLHYDRPVRIEHQSGHFCNGHRRHLAHHLGIDIPQGPIRGEIYLTEEERQRPPQIAESHRHYGPFWIMVAGGKNDFSIKLWDRARYQAVVNHFLGRIQFVQVGEKHHEHKQLQNVINLIGRTDLRQFINLVYHSDGVVCPVTCAMHLAAAVPNRITNNRDRLLGCRPCVVIAGAREPVSWEKYDGHEFFAPGTDLPCAVRNGVRGACWRSRVVPRRDGHWCDDPERICEQPVQEQSGALMSRCMADVTVEMVIAAIERLLLR